MSQAITDRGTVQSVARAFEIIETLAQAHGDLGISELSEQVGLPMPTVHRILKTLITYGYVQQTPRRRYALGVKLIPLSRYAGGALGIALRPLIARYVDELDESISVAMVDQEFARYIAHVPSERSMRMFTEVGNQVSLHATGVGKAILSKFSDGDLRSLLTRVRLRRLTEHTITKADDLIADIERTRERGYALDDQEHEIGVCCVAVPIPGDMRLAVSASGPPPRLTPAWLEFAVPQLTKLAGEIQTAIVES